MNATLPINNYYVTSMDRTSLYTAEQMQAHYQKGRADALDEAAKVCNAANPHPDQYSPLSEYTERRVALMLAEQIRRLKS